MNILKDTNLFLQNQLKMYQIPKEKIKNQTKFYEILYKIYSYFNFDYINYKKVEEEKKEINLNEILNYPKFATFKIFCKENSFSDAIFCLEQHCFIIESISFNAIIELKSQLRI